MNRPMKAAGALTPDTRVGHLVAKLAGFATILLFASLLIPGGWFSPQSCRAGLTQTITFDPFADRTYGDADFSPGATASSGLPVSYASSNPSVATIVGDTIHIVGAGTTNITASQAGDATYDPAIDIVQPLTVAKATPSATAWPTAGTITYGDTLASSTLTGGTASVPGTFAFTTPSTAPTAGTAAQSVTFTPEDTANYNTVTDFVNVTVNKANPTVTTWPTAGPITYGQTLASSTLTGGGAAVAGTFAFTTPTTAPTAGTAEQSVTFTPTDITNYNAVTGSANVTVNPALLIVTAENQSKTYGSADPPLTISYSGFVNGDTAASLTTQPIAVTTANTDSPVGTYPITASGGVSDNYTFTYIAGTLTIIKADPTVTAWPTASTIIYGEALESSVLTGGTASVPGTFAFTAPATIPNAGTAEQAVTFTPADTANYNTVTGSANVTVNKADPVVTDWPMASAITYGEPLASSTLTGGSGSVPGSFGFTAPATIPSSGTAAHGVTFTPTDTANYNTVTGSVNVTVNRADPSVTTWPMATAIVYGQMLVSSSLSGGTASVDGTFAFTTPTTAPDAGTAAQSVTFTPADSINYNTVTGSVSVTVNKADPTISTWPAASAITYGQTLASSSLTGGSASVDGTFTFTTPSTVPNAGTAAQSVTFAPADTSNYNTFTGSADVIVNPAPLTVIADNFSRTYGTPNPALTISYSGFVNGDTEASLAMQPTSSTAAIISTSVGTYPITVSGGVSGNYTFTYVAGTLTVTPAPLTVTADNQSKTYGAPNPALTISYSGFVNGDTAASLSMQPTAATTATLSSTVGTYPITVSGGVDGNYTFTYVAGTLTILSPTINVTLFSMPATATDVTVSVTSFTATDSNGVAGYIVTESPAPPSADEPGWSLNAPEYFSFSGYGSRTAYAWAKDHFGNVSAPLSATVLITGSASTLDINGIASPRTAGTAGTVTVTARDANGYIATTYRGTIRFASSDPQAVLPPDYTFTAADNGVHTFDLAVTLKTSGTQSIMAADIAVPTITGVQGEIVVDPAQAHSLTMAGISSPVIAGTASTVTVTARDPFGNIAKGYTGTVRFTSTDPQAGLPADFSFSAADSGVHLFLSQIVFKTAGIRSLTVTDIGASNLRGTLFGITINPGPATILSIAGITSPRPAEVPSNVTVTLRDAHGNIASGYRGTVRFTSTDPQAILPPDYTFGAGDAGRHVFEFMAVLKSAGLQTVTATDVADPGLAGTHAAIEVTPGVVALQAARVAAGFSHTAVVDTEGRVWTWGKNDAGQLGIGITTDAASPVQVTGISGVVAIAAGYEHTVALKSDGTVWTWGSNEYGQIGDGTTIDRSVPVQVPGVSGITAIAAGSYHSVAIKPDGSIIGWGRNAYGQLGDRSTLNRTQPVQAYGITGVAALAAGANHTLLLTRDGDVWAMGANGSGQLGNGFFGDSAVPVRVQGLAGMKKVAAGLLHSLAIGNDGTAWAWGDNGSGQLGGGTNPTSPYPVQVATLSDVVEMAGGLYHAIALKDDGTLWSWGGNGNGQLGDGTTAGSTVPKRLQEMTAQTGIVALAAGGRHNVVLMGNGTVWTWGDNGSGQLGDGSTSYKEHFVPVQNLADITAIEVGGNHTVVLKSDGTVWTWGKNAFGQLGNGTFVNSSVPGQVTGLTGIVAVVAGTSHTAALKNDGTVWVWGLNESGQLGDGTVTARPLPVQVQGLSDVTAISAGSYFTLALKSDGTVWGWGSNTSGQLGDDTTTSRMAPVRVSGLTGVTAITAGYLHAMALKTDGTVWAWGFNKFGQLGDATNILKKVPVQAGIANAVAIAAGSNHSLALQSGGVLWTWGLNGYGQLGDGTTSDSNVPVEVTTLQGPMAIAAGSNHSMALLWDRSVWLWGDNFYGQLGNGSGENENIPRQVQEFFDVGAIAAGGENSLLVKNDGSLWSVGDNDSGQLGSGTPYMPVVVPGVLLGNDDMPPVTTASLPEGTYEGTQTVALSSSEPATIYYTLDGTTPTTGSARYDSPLSFSSSTVLKFFAVDRAGNGETVKTRNYVVNPQYPLNLYLQGGGSGRLDLSTGGSCTGACSQSFLNGTTVDLTPVPLGDSVFMGWSGCDSVLGQVCRVTVTSARNVTANFDPAYTLSLNFTENGTVSFSTGGSCTGACAKAFRSGTTVELTASGNGTVFEGWAGCDTASGISCTVSMNGSRSVTASFGYLVMASGGKGISIQQAYNQVSGSDVISVRVAEVIEDVTFNRPVTIRLAGGYNSSFTDVTGVSTLRGTMTVSAGSVIVERMVIR